MSRLGDETVGRIATGKCTGIGAAAKRIREESFRAAKGVELAASEGNTGIVYVGNEDVTADADPSTDGFPIPPGERAFFPIDDPRRLYATAGVEGQAVFSQHYEKVWASWIFGQRRRQWIARAGAGLAVAELRDYGSSRRRV